MTNPYNMGYNPYANQGYPHSQKKSSSTFGSVLGMGAFGAISGAGVGYLTNRYPVKKDGKVADAFVKKAVENYVEKVGGSDNKKLYKQSLEILGKIDGVKDSESLKKLLKGKDDALKGISGGLNQSVDNFINSISKDNFNVTKDLLKRNLGSINDYQNKNMESLILKCWDGDAKKFVKPDSVKQKVFDVIKNTKSDFQLKAALKYGGITAGVLGGLTLLYKMFTSNK